MRRALKIVLVIAAFLGLFGQTVAIAASPTTTAIEAPAMPMDCVGMMQGSGDNSMPCNRMTLTCIIGMGCSVPFTLGAGQPVLAETVLRVASLVWPVTSALEERSIQPDPRPPTALA